MPLNDGYGLVVGTKARYFRDNLTISAGTIMAT